MNKNVKIMIIENNDEHFELIRRNLWSAGIHNQILRFTDDREVLEFLFMEHKRPKQEYNREYLLFLDILAPKVKGEQLLKKIKQDSELKKITVIVLTEESDPKTIERCYDSGCGVYITKPLGRESFADTIRKVGLFLSAVEMSQIGPAA